MKNYLSSVLEDVKNNKEHHDCFCFDYKPKTTFNNEKYFIELSYDDESKEFVEGCYSGRYQLFKASFIRPFLTRFYSLTESNAILNTGRMFLISQNHIKTFFGEQTFTSMLDIGAGDGNVTRQFEFLIEGRNITCTETAPKMIKVLKSKGYAIQDKIEGEFDLIACLNVYKLFNIYFRLDRCEKPVTMLQEICKIKKKYVILSIVLPFSGFYSEGVNKFPQKEKLIDYNKSWEESVDNLCEIFIEIGFNIVSISRVPYLSEGNMRKEYFKLNATIFVLS